MPNLKPTAADLVAAADKTVQDVIASNLRVLFCGINPGLYTAAVGHHFARPGNRFWRALFESGFTPHLFHPSEERELLTLGYGITNVVPRASAKASELSEGELRQGGKVLRHKIEQYRPEWVALLGIESYRKAFNRKDARIGYQNETIGLTKIWVLPNPSGLNAHFTPAQLAALFREFKEAVDGSPKVA